MNPLRGCWVPAFTRLQECLLHPWARPCNADGHMTNIVPVNLILNLSTQWFLSSDVRKVSRLIITPMSTPMWPQWANDQNVADLLAKTLHVNLTWNESTQWLLSSRIRKVTRFVSYAPGHAHIALMGKWLSRCTSTDQDASSELNLEWIHPVVAEFQCTQGFMTDYYAHEHAHVVPMGKWPSTVTKCTSTDRDSSKEL